VPLNSYGIAAGPLPAPPSFNEYAVAALANFQNAHGFALFSEMGAQNWAEGYLPIVLNTQNGSAPDVDTDVVPPVTGR